MDYPWWTIDVAEWGFGEEDEIHCLACAETNGQVLGPELTDLEINEVGGVSCQSCGKNWPAVHISGLQCSCTTCALQNRLTSGP